MRNSALLFIIVLFLAACNQKLQGDSDRFKHGSFEIPAGKGYSKTLVKRIDSLQIETYTKYVEVSTDSVVYQRKDTRTDTLFITWKNNFFYTLKMKSPKTELDKDPIFVQITKVTDTSYNFTAKIGYSTFKQDGVIYKVN